MITTDPDTGPIERSERSALVKGYEVSKGEYILLSQGGNQLGQTGKHQDHRHRAVSYAGDEIDRLYWDNPYFLAPDGKLAQEAFGVIRTAMEKSGQIALGRVVIGTRERILALEPRGKGILAYTIRTDAEVRKPDEIFGGISDKAADPAMIKPSPRRSSSSRKVPSTPVKFVDRYEAGVEGADRGQEEGPYPRESRRARRYECGGPDVRFARQLERQGQGRQ